LDAGGKFFKEWGRAQEVRAGDFVFCFFDVDETPRTIGLSPALGMISPDYTVMECRDPLVASYLEYFYLAMDDQKLLKPLYTGLRKRISKPLFLAAKTPLPPTQEMRKILAYIKDSVVEIDKSLDTITREIALMQEYRTRLTADLVTGKLDVREAAAKLPVPPAESTAEETLEEIEMEEIQ
jgi:type I restriction enzyme S subunit